MAWFGNRPAAGSHNPASHLSDRAAGVPAPRAGRPLVGRSDEDLLPAERELLARAAAGEWLDFPGDEEVGLDEMRRWGPERTIRAEVLRRLLVEDHWPVHTRGVLLRTPNFGCVGVGASR